VKRGPEKSSQSFGGRYRPEHVFTLKQSLDGYRYYQKLIAELDREIQRLMQTLPSAVETDKKFHSVPALCFSASRQRPRLRSSRTALPHRGRRLTDIPGVSAVTAQVHLTRGRSDLHRFRKRLCFRILARSVPGECVSGGKILSCKTRRVKNRAALALRLGATLSACQGLLRRIFFVACAPSSNRSSHHCNAHKIARTLYHVLLTKEPYAETVFHKSTTHSSTRRDETSQTRCFTWIQSCQ